MSYVACQMARLQPDHQPCVEAFGISFDEILQCVESEFATRQQLDYEQITRERFFFFFFCVKTSSTMKLIRFFFLRSSNKLHQLGADYRLQWKDYVGSFTHRQRSTAQRNPLQFDSQHQSGLCPQKTILKCQNNFLRWLRRKLAEWMPSQLGRNKWIEVERRLPRRSLRSELDVPDLHRISSSTPIPSSPINFSTRLRLSPFCWIVDLDASRFFTRSNVHLLSRAVILNLATPKKSCSLCSFTRNLALRFCAFGGGKRGSSRFYRPSSRIWLHGSLPVFLSSSLCLHLFLTSLRILPNSSW